MTGYPAESDTSRVSGKALQNCPPENKHLSCVSTVTGSTGSKGPDSLTLTYVEQVLGNISQLLKSEWELYLVGVESRHLEAV